MPVPRMSHVLLLGATAAAATGATTGVSADGGETAHAAARARPVDPVLLADMSQPAEALPHGVPLNYGWAAGPRRAEATAKIRSFSALTGWGQAYQCAQSRVTPRRAILLRDFQTWILRGSTGRWERVQRSSLLSGGAYAENFRGPVLPAAYTRRDRHVTGARLTAGHNFHFWPSGPRVSVPVADVQAVSVVVRARLAAVKGKPVPCVVLSMGLDFWQTPTAKLDPAHYSTSADAGIGRFKRLRTRWRAFTMTSATPAQLHAKPLPLRLPASQLR